jgi:hypothetical protein
MISVMCPSIDVALIAAGKETAKVSPDAVLESAGFMSNEKDAKTARASASYLVILPPASRHPSRLAALAPQDDEF